MTSDACKAEDIEMQTSELDNSLAGQSDAGDEGCLQIVMDEPAEDLPQPDDVEVR